MLPPRMPREGPPEPGNRGTYGRHSHFYAGAPLGPDGTAAWQDYDERCVSPTEAPYPCRPPCKQSTGPRGGLGCIS